jgi:hypothetical protein
MSAIDLRTGPSKAIAWLLVVWITLVWLEWALFLTALANAISLNTGLDVWVMITTFFIDPLAIALLAIAVARGRIGWLLLGSLAVALAVTVWPFVAVGGVPIPV